MSNPVNPVNILVIEDNPGDYVLIEDFLQEEFNDIDSTQAGTFRQAQDILISDPGFEVILLDLSLPDAGGEKLVTKVVELAGDSPVIVLTGYTDKEFSVRTLSLGVSDYLFKDNLNGLELSKSINYSIERKRINKRLRDSEENYRHLFDLSPLPMWVYEIETLKFLNVNEAAVKNYGYSRQEFLSMTIKDIRPQEDMPMLYASIDASRKNKGFNKGTFRHRKKNGKIFEVDIQSNTIDYDGKPARLVLASDISSQMEYIRAIEKQNLIMRDIAWTQSHVVRAPLARLIGLVNLLENYPEENDKHIEIFSHIRYSAMELDQIVREIVRKTEEIEKDAE